MVVEGVGGLMVPLKRDYFVLETMASQIQDTQSVLRETVTALRDLGVESTMLKERTTCYESDRRLVEDKLTEIRDQMEQAAKDCKFSSMAVLRETYRFLAGAYVSLLIGGTDPTYKDDRLKYTYDFQDIDHWKEARGTLSDSGAQVPVCPYTTDYGPHSIGYILGPEQIKPNPEDFRSYGCDQDVLNSDSIHESLDDEATPLVSFMTESDQMQRDFFTKIMNGLGTVSESDPKLLDPPPHAVQSGCLRPKLPSEEDQNDPKKMDAPLFPFPDYFHPSNLTDGNISPLPENTFPEGMLLRSTFDFFLPHPNPFILERMFSNQKEIFGLQRPLAEYLTSPSESYGEFFDKRSGISDIQIIQSELEREMGILESMSRDALEKSQDEGLVLNAAIKSLKSVVTEYLPKKYIPELNYFLLRSCVDGLCQATIDTVLKRTFNPYCIPYTSGKYTEEDAYKKCYCDPEIEDSDATFWNDYCEEDYTDKKGEFEAMGGDEIPACVIETATSSSQN
jgi:hypothetical protein